MRALVLAVAVLLCVGVVCGGALAQTASEWAGQARAHYDAARYAESADAYAKAIEAGAENPTTFYNAACSAALAGRSDAAFEHLAGAIAHRFIDIALLEEDSDLASLRSDDRWKDTLAQCRKALADYVASIENPTLREELLEMRRIDQAVRRGQPLPEWPDATMMDVDAKYTARMKEIIAADGWPTSSVVGEDGARSAWLLVQHADADPAFQRRCLELMLACDPEEVSAVDVAYLTDRVLVNEGKPQIYGTQFWTVDGRVQPRPIADPSLVETLRAEVGLGSMQDYHQRMTGRPWAPDETSE